MTDRFYTAHSLEARVPLLGPSIGRTSLPHSASLSSRSTRKLPHITGKHYAKLYGKAITMYNLSK
jgi:hypothetical protein